MESTKPEVNIFVFGSNLAGRHGKGAALYAFQYHGAVRGQGEGLQGNSYAIPTKDENLKVRTLKDIHKSVDKFLRFARSKPDWQFNVTAIGTGYSGLNHSDIGPMFYFAPSNCKLPIKWKKYVQSSHISFWIS